MKLRRWELSIEYRHPRGAYPPATRRFWTRSGAVLEAGLWKAQGMGTNWRFLLMDRRTGAEWEL